MDLSTMFPPPVQTPQIRPVAPVAPSLPPSSLRPQAGQQGGGALPFPTPPPAPGANSAFLQPGGQIGGSIRNGLIQNMLFGNYYTGQPGALTPMLNQVMNQVSPQAPAQSTAPTSPTQSFAAPKVSSSTSTDSTINSSSPSSFVSSLSDAASQAAQDSGLPPALLLAIAAHETGWGNPSYTLNNNLMGIKGSGGATTPTQEFDPSTGKYYTTNATWKGYETPEASLADFWNFLNQNPRYQQAVNYFQQTNDPQGFLQLVNKAGYATDPNWYQGVLAMVPQIQAMLGSQ